MLAPVFNYFIILCKLVFCLYVCLSIPSGGQKRTSDSQNWSHRQLWAATWVLRIECKSFERAVSVLSSWIIFPALVLTFSKYRKEGVHRNHLCRVGLIRDCSFLVYPFLPFNQFWASMSNAFQFNEKWNCPMETMQNITHNDNFQTMKLKSYRQECHPQQAKSTF